MRPCELEHFHPPDSPEILLTILAHQATGFPVRSRCLLFFSVSAGSRNGLPHTVLLGLSLLVGAGCSASCNTGAGDVGVAELEELVDEPGTTIGAQFAVFHFIRLPSAVTTVVGL